MTEHSGGLDATRAATNPWRTRVSSVKPAGEPAPTPPDASGDESRKPDELKKPKGASSKEGQDAVTCDEIGEVYEGLIRQSNVGWKMDYEMIRPIGQGGQGIVYLVDRYGSYNTRFRLALKFFNPKVYRSTEDYRNDMARLARVAVRLTKLQHDNLIDVHNVVGTRGIDVQTMEWIDGVDLRRLVSHDALESIRDRVSPERWDHLNDAVATPAGSQLRFKPGLAVGIIRRCLAGLGALHRADIVHGDIKPANLMVKRTGSLKLIDLGSAFTTGEPPQRQAWTPRYAAVEVLQRQQPTPKSDLASLGYVLVELLTGELPFASARNQEDLIEQKMRLPDELQHILPPDGDQSLRRIVRQLIDPDPDKRFQSAEDAEMSKGGAVPFLRQLVKGDLDSEYDIELRQWLSDLLPM